MLDSRQIFGFFLAVTFVLVGLGAGYGYAQDAAKIEKSKTRYERLDANKDGLVSRLEYQASRLTRFVKMDQDGNEALNLEEYRDFGNPPPEIAKTRESRFGKMDVDKNGQLSVKEWNAESGRRFKRWDADASGKVTLEEYLKEQRS